MITKNNVDLIVNKLRVLNEGIKSIDNIIGFQEEEIIKTEALIKRLRVCLTEQNNALKKFNDERQQMEEEKENVLQILNRENDDLKVNRKKCETRDEFINEDNCIEKVDLKRKHLEIMNCDTSCKRLKPIIVDDESGIDRGLSVPFQDCVNNEQNYPTSKDKHCTKKVINDLDNSTWCNDTSEWFELSPQHNELRQCDFESDSIEIGHSYGYLAHDSDSVDSSHSDGASNKSRDCDDCPYESRDHIIDTNQFSDSNDNTDASNWRDCDSGSSRNFDNDSVEILIDSDSESDRENCRRRARSSHESPSKSEGISRKKRLIIPELKDRSISSLSIKADTKDIFIGGSAGLLLRYSRGCVHVYETNTDCDITILETVKLSGQMFLIAFTKEQILIYDNFAERPDFVIDMKGVRHVFNDGNVLFMVLNCGTVKRLTKGSWAVSSDKASEPYKSYCYFPATQTGKFALVTKLYDKNLYKISKDGLQQEIVAKVHKIFRIWRVATNHFLCLSRARCWLLTSWLKVKQMWLVPDGIKYACHDSRSVVVCDTSNTVHVYSLNPDTLGVKVFQQRLEGDITALANCDSQVFAAIGDNIFIY